MKLSSKKGFTLIELVVVMAIIAILSLLIVAAITAARAQSVNTQRTGNIKTTEIALEARSAKCGSYTEASKSGMAADTSCKTLVNTVTSFKTLTDNLVTEGWLTSAPTIDDNSQYAVKFNGSNATNYGLAACSNGGSGPSVTLPSTSACTTGYVVYSTFR